MITKVAFVAHPTRDMQATKRFFGEVLGLETSSEYGDMWVEFKAPDGTTIALDTFSAKENASATVYLALETDDIEAEMQRLVQQGVTKVQDVWENKDDAGGTICKMGIIADPGGNMIMLHEIAAHRRTGS